MDEKGEGSSSDSGTNKEGFDDLPRSLWLPRVMRNHPDVLELRERFRPLGKTASFGRVFNSGKTEVKETLSHKVVLQLIIQFLEEEGMEETKRVLIEDTKAAVTHLTDFPPHTLEALLRVGISDPKSIFEPHSRDPTEDDPEVFMFNHIDSQAMEEDEQPQVWENTPKDIVFDPETKSVISAPLNSLIAWLVSSENKHMMAFRKIFLLTHKSFVSSEVVLRKLLQRYTHSPKDESADIKKQALQRIFAVLKYWIDMQPEDWNEKQISSLSNFIDNTLVNDGHLQIAKHLRAAISKRDNNVDRAMNPQASPEPIVPKNIFSSTLTLDHVDPEEIARQLTLLEYNIFKDLVPSEMLCRAWSDANLHHRAPNLSALLKRTDQLSCWVTVSVLEGKTVKDRVRVIARFIKIAEHLLTMNNFNTLFAIYAGLNNTSVRRLQFTKNALSKDVLKGVQTLDTVFDRDGSYDKYRQTFSRMMPPAVPFMALHLRDISTAEECQQLAPDRIDFQSKERISEIITHVLSPQSVKYKFHHVHQISTFLTEFPPILSEEELFKMSLIAEPRNFSEVV